MAYTFDPNRGAYVAPGSETSERAAEAIELANRSEKLERMVYAVIEKAGPQGLADFEIDLALRSHLAPGATARPRRCRLRDTGQIRDTGETVRNPATNRSQARWALAGHIADDGRQDRRVVRPAQPEAVEDRARAWLQAIDNLHLPPIIERLADDLRVLEGLWNRPDLTEAERLDAVSTRLARASTEVDRLAEQLRREAQWQATGQVALDFGKEGS
jgi:hypothetical protein